MSTVERKKGGGPSGSRAQSAVKRAEIIKLRLAGHTLEAVADVVGLTSVGVRYHEQAWLAEQTPSAEVTEERRQKQLAGIDQVRSRLFSDLAEADELAARLAVVDRLDKLWSREARLVGLDMQQGVSVAVVTAEAMASWLGWSDEGVIEGTAIEIEAAPDAAAE